MSLTYNSRLSVSEIKTKAKNAYLCLAPVNEVDNHASMGESGAKVMCRCCGETVLFCGSLALLKDQIIALKSRSEPFSTLG